jgi:type III pantothenate kinase
MACAPNVINALQASKYNLEQYIIICNRQLQIVNRKSQIKNSYTRFCFTCFCMDHSTMDINLLVINVGNSRVAVGAFVQGELAYTQRIDLEQRSDIEEAVDQAWSHLRNTDADVAAASVNPIMNEAIEHAIVRATQQPVQWVGREIHLPMKVITELPQQTGVDRVLVTAAAYDLMQKACVVVDAGTAITVNLCSDAGEFLGGAIAPGAQLMLKSLNEHTAKLPLLKPGIPENALGKSTEQAMLSGVYHGIRGMVKELVEGFALDLGNWPEVICTGGDAELLFEGWELAHAVSPDLMLYGIAHAYTEHHLKNA